MFIRIKELLITVINNDKNRKQFVNFKKYVREFTRNEWNICRKVFGTLR